MERLNQLVTRLLIVALIVVAAWIGRAHLGKQALVYHLQSYVGAQVDAKHLSLNNNEATVFLSQVEVANPLVEMENLLQFEAASLKLDFDSLKDRRVVIKEGRLSQIKFSAPRTKSGQIKRGIFDAAYRPEKENTTRSAPVAGVPQVDESLRNYPLAQRWRDSLIVDVNQSSGPVADSFETGSLVNQKSQQWAARFKEPFERISRVEADLSMVEEVLSGRVDRLNPLRGEDKLKDAFAALDSSLESLSHVGTLIPRFETQSQKDIYELSQVQMRDQQSLTTSLSVQKFDSNLLNQMLVGELERKLVADGLGWFQQFRNSIPNPATDFRPMKRGRDLYFGVEQKPKVEIEKLQIDGAAEFANAHFNFAGTLENVSDAPHLGEHPVKFQLRAQGDPQVIVSGVLDRTKGNMIDEIQFTGIGIPQPAYLLGEDESILISMTDQSRLHVEATLHAGAKGELGGTMKFRFDDVVLHADDVHQSAGGLETAARLNESVSGINSFQITTTVGGTLANPTTRMASDLGPQVARALESVFNDSQQLVRRKKETLLNRTLNGELAQLKENVSQGIAKLNESWRANYSRYNQLNKQISTARAPSKERPGKLR